MAIGEGKGHVYTTKESVATSTSDATNLAV